MSTRTKSVVFLGVLSGLCACGLIVGTQEKTLDPSLCFDPVLGMDVQCNAGGGGGSSSQETTGSGAGTGSSSAAGGTSSGSTSHSSVSTSSAGGSPAMGGGGAGSNAGASVSSVGAGGDCATACTNMHGTNTCAGFQCVPTCAAGFGDCDGKPENGCETDLTTNDNCGSCTNMCTDAPVSCKNEVCYNYEWAEWPMPNSATLPNPEQYATGNGGVVDNVTGLIWQEPIDGNNQMGQNCSTGCTQSDAAAYCSTLALGGFSNWRLPTYIELVSLLDYSYQLNPPLINQAAFPSTPQDFFWSSTPVANVPNYGWDISFDAGYVSPTGNTGRARVRCVR